VNFRVLAWPLVLAWTGLMVGTPPAVAADKAKKPAAKVAAPASKASNSSPAKPASAAATNPFARFPRAVELPPLPAPDAALQDPPRPAILGAIDLPAQKICLIQLLGATELLKKNQSLNLEAEAEPQPARAWEVVFREGGETGTHATLARLTLKGGQLEFAWTKLAATAPAAGQLANCVLKFAAGEGTQLLALRRSAKIAGQAFTFEEDMVSRWEVPNPPPPEQLQVELRLAGTEIPRYRFVGSSTLRPGESTWIEILKPKSVREALKFRVDCQWKKSLEVSVTPYLQTALDAKPVRLTDATRKKAETQARILQQQIKLQQMAESPMTKKKGGKVKGEQKGQGGAKSPVTQQLATARLVVSQVNELETLQTSLAGKTRLEFRVFRLAEQVPVELLSSAPRLAPGTKK